MYPAKVFVVRYFKTAEVPFVRILPSSRPPVDVSLYTKICQRLIGLYSVLGSVVFSRSTNVMRIFIFYAATVLFLTFEWNTESC